MGALAWINLCRPAFWYAPQKEMEKRNPTVEPSPPHRSAAPLKVHLLGRFEVIRGDLPIPAQSWRRRRPADLLKLIALAPGGSLPRERVFELLWPGKDSASGANNLHRALYDLRHVLDGRWIDLEQGQVRLHPEVWVDVVAFESAVAARDPSARQTAVALYGGELSPEDRESAWLAQRRLDLRRLFAQSAFPLARAAVARGDAAAVPLLRRILEGEPATEEAHQLLMRALVDSGQRADALRQFDACEAALRVLGGGPGSETRALREAILQGSVGPVRARTTYDGYLRASRRLLGTSDPPPLRGRAAALVLLQSMVEQGSGVLVLLGERGVGKTRLALEGARIAQERGALVLAGLVGGTITGPCAPFADAWSDYRRATGLGGEDPFAEYVGERNRTDDVKRRIQEDALRLLIRAGGGRPIYLLLEDIHGADEPSLNLLHYLARSARGAGLMLVATCREDEVHSGAPIQMALSHLDCERLARGIRVQRLDLEATRLQITDILGEAPRDALAAQIYRITDGSPFYTEEMARAFKESGQLAPAQNPTAAVCARVARLGPAVEAVLSAAAVAGQRFDFAVVSMASGLPRDEALRALDVCLAGRLLEEDGAGCHFHH